MKKRVFVLLLCLALLCPLLPTAALATEDITSIRVNVSELKASQSPTVPKLSPLDAEKATVSSYEWRDAETDLKLNAGDPCDVGKTYRLTVTCSAKPGYAFTSTTKTEFNKNFLKGTVLDQSESDITFCRDFMAYGPDINAVEVTVTPPETGALPTFAASESNPRYRIYTEESSKYYSNGVNWFDMTYDPTKDEAGSMILSGAAFEAGKSYRVVVALYPEKGYRFATDVSGNPAVTVTVNGNVSTETASLWYNEIMIRYDFPALPAPAIDSLKIGVAQPWAGETPDFAPTLPENTALVTDYPATGYIGGVRWTDSTTGIQLGTDDTFIEGHEYTLRLALRAVDCTFKNDGTDVDVSFTVNGGEAKAAKSLTAAGYDDPAAYLSMMWTFPPAEKQDKAVKDVKLSVAAPALGETPDLSPTLDAVGAKLLYTEWTEHFDTLEPYMALGASDTFRDNTVYGVTFRLSAEEDYTLADLTEADVTVNGAAPYALWREGDDVVVRYLFDPLPIPIETVAAWITAPKAGEYPEYASFETIEGACYQDSDYIVGDYTHGIAWYDTTGGGSVLLNTSDKFQIGRTYRAALRLLHPEGYEFPASPAVSINELPAEILSVTPDVLEIAVDFPGPLTRTLQSITIEIPPTKTEYIAGEVFDPAGMMVMAFYSDYAYEEVTGWTVTPEVLTTKDNAVTISYTEDAVTVTTQALITVTPKLQSIAVTTAPEKTDYLHGDAFDPAGMVVTAYYADGTEAPVTGYIIDPETLQQGETYVTVSYTEDGATETATIPVTVLPKLLNIVISTSADRTDYIAGEVFDPTGLQIAAQYSDGSVLTVESFTVPTEPLTKEDVEITVSYTENGVTATTVHPITVKGQWTLVSLEIREAPAKTEYSAGQFFDPAGMVVVAYYENDSEAEVAGYTWTPEGALTESDGIVTLSYTEGDITITAEQAIIVMPEKKLDDIRIINLPNNTDYTAGELFDPAGMTVIAFYTDGTQEYVSGWTVPTEPLTEADTFVTVSYTEGDVTATAEQVIMVRSARANPFSDIFETDYFYNAVLWAYYAEPFVTNGMDATHFGPATTVKREHAVTFLWRAMGEPEPQAAENPFVDVKETDYFYKAVLWAVENGITKGTDATHFTPQQTCSTAHILTFLYRTLGVGEDGWYTEAEAWAKGAGLLDGLELTVAPGVDCPRADVVYFLWRALGK